MLDFSYDVQNDIQVEFRSFIGRIDKCIYEKGRSSQEYYNVIKQFEEKIIEAVTEYNDSRNSIGSVLNSFGCGEAAYEKARKIPLKMIEYVKFSSDSQNKLDLSVEEFKEEIKADIIADADRMVKVYSDSNNIILQSLAVMYTLIAKNISTGKYKQTEVNNDVKGIDKLRANVNKAIEEQKRNKNDWTY